MTKTLTTEELRDALTATVESLTNKWRKASEEVTFAREQVVGADESLRAAEMRLYEIEDEILDIEDYLRQHEA